ncbi:hypothetical protein SDC9_36646 [bioreactor metagenome]|uniref:Uncharacterized protein n=1 Tax=bioreactor metagenome TaxID=1076179 RepID=A0A644VIV1_9ZZZZ|nr:hypothetical protein [Paludibacter sp.]
MKKTTLLLAVLAFTMLSHAQRISELTVEGITSLVPFAAFNPTNYDSSKPTQVPVPGTGEIIYPDGTDLSNVNVSLNVGTDSYIETPNPLPTDWSSTVSGIRVTKTASPPVIWGEYNITLKKIKPAALPLEIKTGTGNFDSNSWTTSTLGWAGACIDKNQTLIRFGSVKRSFVVAFTDAPDSLYYTIKYLTTSFPTDGTVVFDVDGSADGINWTSINQYNATNPMPLSSPAVKAELKIAPQYRYIRWIFTKRGSTNVSLENILVTKDSTTGNATHLANSVKLYPVGSKALQLESSEDVKSLRLYNITGTMVLEKMNPGSEISVNDLIPGIYIGEVRLKNGNVISKKIKF